MQHLSREAIQAIAVPPPMTRRDKLLRWADLIERYNGDLVIFHKLEYVSPCHLGSYGGHGSAFGVASGDPVFRDAGLAGGTASDAMNFFELSQEELHEFSCDCGGHISNTMMAARVRRLAGPGQSGGLPHGAVMLALLVASSVGFATIMHLLAA